MTINFKTPEQNVQLKPRITVFGVGGAGGNAVNNMINKHLEGVDFVVANTDAQAISQSLSERQVQLGISITHGLGAGARPEMGRAAAEEAIEDISQHLNGSHMVFIAAGMGGGTGTGAAPVIARLAREQGMLTVGVVTKPFQFEGNNRMRIAESGIEEMQQFVDTLIVIPNQNLFRIANEKTTFADAFSMADDVLHSGVRGVTDLMVVPGLINLDFADIRSVMSEMGKAMMGTGEAEGNERAKTAAEAAISNPLLDDVTMRGARGVLINITGGPDMTLFEVDEAANRIGEEVDAEANIIFGSALDVALEGKIRVSVVATGIDAEANAEPRSVLRVVNEEIKHKTLNVSDQRQENNAVAESLIDVMEKTSNPENSKTPLDPGSLEDTDSPKVSNTDSFIPPQPEKVKLPEITRKAPDPFREADFVNASPPVQKKRTKSILQRVTSAAWPRRDDQERSQSVSVLDQKPVSPAPSLSTTPRKSEEKEESDSVLITTNDGLTEPTDPDQHQPKEDSEMGKEFVSENTSAVFIEKAQKPINPKPAIQHNLKGVSISNSDPKPNNEEDLLDIPAFLRRQAN